VEAGDGGRRDGRAATVGRSVGRSMWASPARTSRGIERTGGRRGGCRRSSSTTSSMTRGTTRRDAAMAGDRGLVREDGDGDGDGAVDARSRALAVETVAYAVESGLMIGGDVAGTFTHAPVSCGPTPFPRDAYELARETSPGFAELYDRVSRDDEFLRETLRGAIKNDDFTAALWRVYEESGGQEGRVGAEVGVLRSDYMLDAPSGLPLQVEVNTVSTSFMALGSKVSDMHRHLAKWSANNDEVPDLSAIPENDALACAGDTLAAGWKVMGSKGKIMMVVQPQERNMFDQRHIAQYMFERYGVHSVRATLAEVNAEGALRDGTLTFRGDDIGLVYFRAGYTPTDYPTQGEWDARLLIEKSDALKSPSVAMHLAGSKKIQQKLAEAGVLEKFMPEKAADMRRVFAGLYSLDGDEGTEAVKLGLANPAGYVLKPQREGGGNNLYSEELRERLEQGGDLGAFILMQRILPPSHQTLTVRAGKVLEIETLSELGIFGSYLRVGDEIVMNKHGGHLLRTKAASSDEGGVAAGYAVLDSPLLV